MVRINHYGDYKTLSRFKCCHQNKLAGDLLGAGDKLCFRYARPTQVRSLLKKAPFLGTIYRLGLGLPTPSSHDQLRIDQHLYTGQINGEFAPTFPFTVTLEVLQQGQERFNIFCSPCHGRLGDGQSIMVEYGLEAPPSFHTQDMRDEPPGYYFDIITRGTRVMPSYASRIPPGDRWAIIAYIRALQLSQNADLSTVPPQEIPNLDQTDVITQ